MSSAKPYMTSQDIIDSVKRKIMFPISSVTFSELDILSFCNEEMFLSQVPSILQYHQEYFVYNIKVPLLSNVNRYPIPDRAIGMKLRELFWTDAQGNYFEMTRIQSEDKAFFQRNIGANQAIHKFYMEGNDVVLTPLVIGNPTGFLNFFIYLRPNQLVLNNRASTVTNFIKDLTIDNAHIVAGDTLTITNFDISGNPTVFILTAIASGSPTPSQFVIGGTSIITAGNLAAAISASTAVVSATNGIPTSAIVSINYTTLNTTFVASNILGIIVSTSQGVQFDNVNTTWLNPVTGITEPLYVNLELVDFLQTNPGHRIRAFDKQIPLNGISGNVIMFNAGDVPSDLVIGDYICLANECIIPLLPPDVHNGLAERTCARILAALGDQAGLAISQQKIAEIDTKQGNILDNRVEGSPLKITARKSLLRYGKSGVGRRF